MFYNNLWEFAVTLVMLILILNAVKQDYWASRELWPCVSIGLRTSSVTRHTLKSCEGLFNIDVYFVSVERLGKFNTKTSIWNLKFISINFNIDA